MREEYDIKNRIDAIEWIETNKNDVALAQKKVGAKPTFFNKL